MMTEARCAECGVTLKIDMDAARKEYKETFNREVTDEVILCNDCYNKLMNDALNLMKTDKEN